MINDSCLCSRHFTGQPYYLRIPCGAHANGLDKGCSRLWSSQLILIVSCLHAVGRFAASLGSDVSVNLLPYHKLGESKNESLGHPRSLGIEPPSDEHMEALKEIVESHGVQVKIGG